MRKLTLYFGVLLALCAAVLLPADAHAHLKSSAPANKGTVKKMPAQVVLVFSEPLELKLSHFAVVPLQIPASSSAAEREQAANKILAELDAKRNIPGRIDEAPVPKSGRSMDVKIPVSGADAGPAWYAVVWKVLAADGHVSKDFIIFQVAP